jgi:glycosyltransferase involved in cell wall biosynthesis
MTQPVLSICIPTYNRAQYLLRTLDSICSQKRFKDTDDVEIVVSDNGSVDNTKEICLYAIARHPGKIVYNRIGKTTERAEDNYLKVLSIATGKFMKLHNDNFLIVNGGLDRIVNMIETYLHQRTPPIIFFANNPDSSIPYTMSCETFDSFITNISYHCTWIGGFGIWKSDFDILKDTFLKEREKRLIQVDLLVRMANNEIPKSILVCNEFLFPCMEVVGKSGWNIAEVFGHNYLSIIKPALISSDVYQEEKKKVLLEMIIPYYFNLDGKHNFKRDGFFKHLTEYWNDDYFYEEIEKLLEENIYAK